MRSYARLLRLACMAVLASALLFSTWHPLPAAAQEGSGSRLITVTGDAEVRVMPDEVILTLGVENADPDLAKAKQMNDEIVRDVFEVAAGYQIDPAHIQTDYISIEPVYRDYPRIDFLHYLVRKTVVITLKDISQFEGLFTDVLGAGVDVVHGVQFRTTELRTYRDQARALAVRAAREKAEALAAELGQEIGQPSMIREEQSGWWSWYNTWWGSRLGGNMAQNVVQSVGGSAIPEDSTVAPGQIAVTARVTVSFELQ